MTDKLKEAAEHKFKALSGLYLIKPEMKEAVVTIFIAGAEWARKEALEMLRALPVRADAEWYADYLEKKWKE